MDLSRNCNTRNLANSSLSNLNPLLRRALKQSKLTLDLNTITGRLEFAGSPAFGLSGFNSKTLAFGSKLLAETLRLLKRSTVTFTESLSVKTQESQSLDIQTWATTSILKSSHTKIGSVSTTPKDATRIFTPNCQFSTHLFS